MEGRNVVDEKKDLTERLKFVEYKLNLIMENLEVLSESKKKTVMELWKSRGKKEEEVK